MSEIEAYLRQSALARGIDPDIAVRVARGEGGLKDPFRHGEGPAPKSQLAAFGTREHSFGPLQLYISGTGAGLGDRALAAGIDPRKNWKGGVDFALDEVRKKGWGQWYGAKAQGITGMMGVNGKPGPAAAPYFGTDSKSVAPTASAAMLSPTPVAAQARDYSPPTAADQLSPDAAAAMFAPQATPGAMPFAPSSSFGEQSMLAGMLSGLGEQITQGIQQASNQPPEQKPVDAAAIMPELRQVAPTIQAPQLGALPDATGGLAEVFQKLQSQPIPTGSMFRPSRLA